mmetsp:Transcript_39052/g.62579  ORF Transcript_39052/g.62579 Transcript_39052/m.62579 type:complete len:107 (+) Transcript_39052:1031-1351(+)
MSRTTSATLSRLYQTFVVDVYAKSTCLHLLFPVLLCSIQVPLAVVVLFLIDVYKTGRYKHWMYGARSADQNKKMITPGGFLGFSFMTKWIAFFSFGAVLYYLKQRP